MIEKYSELDENKKEEIESLINLIEDTKEFEEGPTIPSICGLCQDCIYFRLAKTEFEIVHASCSELEIFLDPTKPIKYCSLYRKKGQMSLWDMKQIATIIDVPKQKAGFLS